MLEAQLGRDRDQIAPRLSIMIPTKNRPDSLHRLLDSIQRQDYQDWEILVIDDGSEPPFELVASNIRVLRNDVSQGQMFARNLGLAHARGAFVIHFDDDVELNDPTFLRRAMERAENHPECGAIGFCQLTSDGQRTSMQPTSSDQPCYTAFFYGCGFLLRAEAYHRVGGFDEDFGYYFDEPEYCLRLRDAGYRVLYDPTLVLIHHSDPRGRDWRRINLLIARNAIWTVLLHYPWWLVPPAVAKVLLRRGAAHYDWRDLPWLLGTLIRSFPRIWRRRRPLKQTTVLESPRLRRNPEIIESKVKYINI